MRFTMVLFSLFVAVVLHAQVACDSPPTCVRRATPLFNASHLRNDLIGRYPDLLKKPYEKWLNEHGDVINWREERGDDEIRFVTIETERAVAKLKAVVGVGYAKILDSHFYELSDRGVTRSGAFDAAMHSLQPGQRLEALYIAVVHGKVQWLANIIDADQRKTFSISRKLRLVNVAPIVVSTTPRRVFAVVPETLASNDLHHPTLFKSQIDTLTTGMTQNRKKATTIMNEVRRVLSFDTTGDLRTMTMADTITIKSGKGACDEWAVLTVSYLRAANIHSRIRYLTASNSDAHAFVEYQDEQGIWRHLDALYNGNDKPGVYQYNKRMADICVLVADHPDDKRSTEASFCTPDVSDSDGILNPYCDVLLSPSLPGEVSPFYSDLQADCTP